LDATDCRALARCRQRLQKQRMTRLPPRPALSWTPNGSPRSEDADDIFFAGDGLAETRAVFLAGCGLPEAWAGRKIFTVGELGFGTGLNILALWEMWRRHRPSPTARLSVITFEHALMTADEAGRVHAQYPDVAEVSKLLRDNWPVRTRGVQRIELGDGVSLTIAIDDALTALRQMRASVDAWFLDGFAPSKNPDMWSAEVFAELARLSAPGSRLATYTVAGVVRRGLAAAGFDVRRLPGHAGKRERLEALAGGDPGAVREAVCRRLLRVNQDQRARIVVVGAGAAGANVARAFRLRGCEVTVVEAGSAPGAGASGNPVALVQPRFDAADTPAARALVGAWLMARRVYGALAGAAAVAMDAMRLPGSPREGDRFAKLLSDPPLEAGLLRALDGADPAAGLLSQSMAVNPAVALPALLDGCDVRTGVRVARIETADGGAVCRLEDGGVLEADLVVVCAGDRLPAIAGLEAPAIEGRLGQLEHCATSAAPFATADGGYAVSAFRRLVFGATFEPAREVEPQESLLAREHNIGVLARLRPDLAAELDGDALSSRAAIRATTQDRLPFAGAPPGEDPPETVRLVGGLGSRGWLWAPLLAEIVASEAFGEPAPCEATALNALSPDRFRRRLIRKSH
jgi:tRNA 5-methylaminomethyl-2-thiouridine biosynthesis bifunctional protein